MHHFDHIVASLCFERDGVSLPDFSRLFAYQSRSVFVRIQVINPTPASAMTETIGALRVRFSKRTAPRSLRSVPRWGAN